LTGRKPTAFQEATTPTLGWRDKGKGSNSGVQKPTSADESEDSDTPPQRLEVMSCQAGHGTETPWASLFFKSSSLSTRSSFGQRKEWI
jgi:hypothetical protein